ncbi:uncharacterized protein LOC129716814 [Wyeomyia smithii]|uniref:uncharacterized protein LOC129716814 n=1 Tax=Wyeomyia smithii TaxID=174621 RepID=UPI002467E4D6|nr:uncharacterized protein LOC129716814 [Wyeomyia smithii]
MDADQFNVFMEHQSGVFKEMVDALRQMRAPQQSSRSSMDKASAIPVPLPPLELEGDMEQNYEFFVQNWKNYASAVGMDKWPADQNRQKTSVLLSVIGKSALKKYFNFELTDSQQQDPDVAIEAIKRKVVCEKNKMVDWYSYFSMTQDVTESIDEFVSRLKSLAKLCRFETLEEDFIMYKVVTSSKWPKLRGKLLTTQNLTSGKAIDMCRTEEIAEKHAAVAGLSSADVNLVKSKKKKMKCKYCGDWHDFAKGSCPALGKKCHGCGGRNHFEKVCKAQGKKIKNKRRNVKKVQNDSISTSQSEGSDNSETESEEEEKEVVIGKVYDFSDAGGNVFADLKIFISKRWQSVRCELDTGANTSIVGIDWLKKATGGNSPDLLPSKFRLQSFGRGTIPVLGEVRIPCRRNGRKYTLALQVVNVNHMPLLSAKAEQLVKQHKQLFEGYGKFPGVVCLEVDPNVVPSIQQPRRVPIAMRSLLKEDLRKLERDSIIMKETQHMDWVSNIVLIRKGGQTGPVRICLDPIPLNKALKRPRLQFATIDEVLPELGQAKVFSTVDAKKGFWHVLLDNESSRLTTFWTPFGRYRTECLADDILIYGSGETLREALEDHNRNLKELFLQLDRNNVKLNLSKLKLCETSVKFFGHILTNQGLKADDSKIATIKEFPSPTDRKQLQRFIGTINYLGRYIKNLSAESSLLRRLISEKEP